MKKIFNRQGEIYLKRFSSVIISFASLVSYFWLLHTHESPECVHLSLEVELHLSSYQIRHKSSLYNLSNTIALEPARISTGRECGMQKSICKTFISQLI